MNQYKILLNRITKDKIEKYQKSIIQNTKKPGKYLLEGLKNEDTSKLDLEEFLEILVNTKKTRIYAESEVNGNGSDWNRDELSILGDIGIAVPVLAFDNGLHRNPLLNSPPLDSFLVFVPGALLVGLLQTNSPDIEEIEKENLFYKQGYFSLYERRLYTPFLYINSICEQRNKKAIITIPGIGCGQFAGKYIYKLGIHLKEALVEFLKKYAHIFPHIRVVYFDPYNECENERMHLDHINFLVRPLTKGNERKPQLCYPWEFQEENDDFSDLILFSIVAWDHASWPGNDFFGGSRATDDGVKAAATNSMEKMTGIKGHYDTTKKMFLPPDEYRNWSEVVIKNNLKIVVKENVFYG